MALQCLSCNHVPSQPSQEAGWRLVWRHLSAAHCTPQLVAADYHCLCKLLVFGARLLHMLAACCCCHCVSPTLPPGLRAASNPALHSPYTLLSIGVDAIAAPPLFNSKLHPAHFCRLYASAAAIAGEKVLAVASCKRTSSTTVLHTTTSLMAGCSRKSI